MTDEPRILPRITDLAARVRDGEDSHAIARELGVPHTTLLARFTWSGFARTGYSLNEQRRRELRAHLKQARDSRLDDSWMGEAACRSIGTDAFYPSPNDGTVYARAVCQGCPVIDRCLDWVMRAELGLGYKLRFGIHAGMTARERVKYEPQWLAEQESAA